MSVDLLGPLFIILYVFVYDHNIIGHHILILAALSWESVVSFLYKSNVQVFVYSSVIKTDDLNEYCDCRWSTPLWLT